MPGPDGPTANGCNQGGMGRCRGLQAAGRLTRPAPRPARLASFPRTATGTREPVETRGRRGAEAEGCAGGGGGRRTSEASLCSRGGLTYWLLADCYPHRAPAPTTSIARALSLTECNWSGPASPLLQHPSTAPATSSTRSRMPRTRRTSRFSSGRSGPIPCCSSRPGRPTTATFVSRLAASRSERYDCL